jgi:radical SAM protein with 4Fe4S-binding SPASM domain
MNCGGIPTIARKEFIQGLLPQIIRKRIPISGTIEPSFRCNLNCVHCYVNLPAADREARRKEMSAERILRLIDELAEMGTLFLCFTGGEILIRPDFWECYHRALDRGMLVTLFTNGTMVTAKVADELAKRPPLSVEISIYGRTKEVYERVTGVPGSFERCTRGIELLHRRGIKLSLKTVAIRPNAHELSQMREYAQSLGAEFRFDPMINGRIDFKKGPEQTRLSPEEVVALDAADPNRVKTFQSYCQSTIFPAMSEALLTCGAGKFGFFVDPYGRLSGCSLLREPSYDLNAGSFAEGWNRFLPEQVRALRRTKATRCGSCGIRNMCTGCPGFSYLEHGDPEEPVDWVCDVTHERARAFGHPGLLKIGSGA